MSTPWGAAAPYPPPVQPARAGGAPAPSWQRQLRGEARTAAALLGAGLLLGAVWALAAPGVARAADAAESHIAVDGLLALLGLGAGVVTAVAVALAPGRHPVARLAVVLVSATLAGLLAAGVGLARGLELRAPGAALVWPLVASVLTAARLLVSMIGSPDGAAPRVRRHA